MAKKNKKNKSISVYSIVALASALILGGTFTFLSMQTFQKVPLLVAARNIEPYSIALLETDFKIIEVSKGDAVNFDGFTKDLSSLIGKIPTVAIYEGQPVKDVQFIHPDDAIGIQNVVSNDKYRGIYLPLTQDNALQGDVKIGGAYDFYIATLIDVPKEGDLEAKEDIIIPLQSSYRVNKIVVAEDGKVNVFFDFPEKESEEYIMVKKMLSESKATLYATMPNAIHENYDGAILKFSDFYASMLSKGKFFTSVSQEKAKEEVKVDSTNDLEKAVEKTEEKPVKEDTKKNND